MKKIALIAPAIAAFICLSGLSARAGTFARPETVVVSGDLLAPLFGTEPEKLSLYATTSAGFEPVPFQIDQMVRKGRKKEYIYKGCPRTPKHDPNLDMPDELVFWSGDAGQRASQAEWPPATSGVEIEVTDPVSGSTGYVYLLAFPSAAPRSDRSYIKYNPETDTVEALYYKLDYPTNDELGFTDLAITGEAGGSGEDFVDEAKYRVAVRLGGTIIPYDLDKRQLHTKIIGYVEGPVRVRRRMINYLELFVWLGSTSVAESVYTPSGFSIQIPVIGGLPIKALTNLSSRWSLELNSKAIGMTFKSDKNPQGVEIDGVYSEAERNMDYSPPDWLLISGAPGALIRRPGKLSDRKLFIDLYYMDNMEYNEEGEESPGQIGAAGYYIPFAGRRGLKIRENIVDFFDVLPNYKEGDEKGFIERYGKPIEIKVSEMAVANRPMGPTPRPEPASRPDEAAPTYNYVGSEAPPIESQWLPVIVMSSDNGFGGGIMYVNANPFGTGIRLMSQAWYTIKSYSLFEIELGEERPQEGGDMGQKLYAKYSLKPGRDFYGLGNDSERDWQTNYYDEMFQLKYLINRRIAGPFWLGAYAEVHREFTGEGEGDWAPDTFAPEWFPDLLGKGAFWTNRIGAFVLIDTRDSIYIPTQGGYYKLEYYSVADWLGSDYSFEYWYLDLRQFFTIRAPRKDILALRFQAQHAGGGPIPFYELAKAGSEYTLRGYFDGRFRDRDMACVNVEIRHNLWKIIDIHFFYDIGRVYGDMFDEWRYIANDTHNAYGTGFRITIPPNIVMRGDVGWSDTDQVFYFNWGQTF